MTATIQTLLLLLAVLVVVAVAARRLNTAPSILLVIAGLGLALTPGLPRIELAPELVLLGILPPLIYSAGVAMSWREFRFNLRPITLLAFGCVVFTTCADGGQAGSYRDHKDATPHLQVPRCIGAHPTMAGVGQEVSYVSG